MATATRNEGNEGIAIAQGIIVVDNGTNVVLEIKTDGPRRVSSTGKTLLVATGSYITSDGVKVAINATVPNPDYVKPAKA